MFEKWAISFANYIKQVNPEETEPHDVLVYGFTILFNLLFTFLCIFSIGWALGVPFLAVQVAVSFTILRILTGGAHLDQSLACSLTSFVLIFLFILLPQDPYIIWGTGIIGFLFILMFAPYYEEHQLKHSKKWEMKKKLVAVLWVIAAFTMYMLFSHQGYLSGVFLQGLMLTPYGIKITHRFNKMITNGGERNEKVS